MVIPTGHVFHVLAARSFGDTPTAVVSSMDGAGTTVQRVTVNRSWHSRNSWGQNDEENQPFPPDGGGVFKTFKGVSVVFFCVFFLSNVLHSLGGKISG